MDFKTQKFRLYWVRVGTGIPVFVPGEYTKEQAAKRVAALRRGEKSSSASGETAGDVVRYWLQPIVRVELKRDGSENGYPRYAICVNGQVCGVLFNRIWPCGWKVKDYLPSLSFLKDLFWLSGTDACRSIAALVQENLENKCHKEVVARPPARPEHEYDLPCPVCDSLAEVGLETSDHEEA